MITGLYHRNGYIDVRLYLDIDGSIRHAPGECEQTWKIEGKQLTFYDNLGHHRVVMREIAKGRYSGLMDDAMEVGFTESEPEVKTEEFSVAIVTFEHRFDTYFTKLVNKIHEYEPDAEMVIAVNGEHLKQFDNKYRARMLRFLGSVPNTFPSIFTTFRSLSKLWNHCLTNATHDWVLLLNDDVEIHSSDFFSSLRDAITTSGNQSFKINGSWSHCMLYRPQIAELGYFDERFLGIGEEDADMEWRFGAAYGNTIANSTMPGITNFVHYHKPTNIQSWGETKYSTWNREFMYGGKYRSSSRGQTFGISNTPLVEVDGVVPQYPYEEYWRKNRHSL